MHTPSAPAPAGPTRRFRMLGARVSRKSRRPWPGRGPMPRRPAPPAPPGPRSSGGRPRGPRGRPGGARPARAPAQGARSRRGHRPGPPPTTATGNRRASRGRRRATAGWAAGRTRTNRRPRQRRHRSRSATSHPKGAGRLASTTAWRRRNPGSKTAIEGPRPNRAHSATWCSMSAPVVDIGEPRSEVHRTGVDDADAQRHRRRRAARCGRSASPRRRRR